jgi:hypothetical protein
MDIWTERAAAAAALLLIGLGSAWAGANIAQISQTPAQLENPFMFNQRTVEICFTNPGMLERAASGLSDAPAFCPFRR